MDTIANIIDPIKSWSNLNSGFLTLIIFITTLFMGWITGFFKALLRKPELSFAINYGPSFCCTSPTGRKHNGHDSHLTAIALYLSVSNVGSAPTEITAVEIAYHNYSFKYTFIWFWIREQVTIMNDFQIAIGDDVLKIYPFLFQKSRLDGQRASTYLREAEKTTGMVYFEQPESWGNFLPRNIDGQTKLKIILVDTHGKKYSKVERVPVISIDEARKFNPAIGMSREAMRDDTGVRQN